MITTVLDITHAEVLWVFCVSLLAILLCKQAIENFLL